MKKLSKLKEIKYHINFHLTINKDINLITSYFFLDLRHKSQYLFDTIED